MVCRVLGTRHPFTADILVSLGHCHHQSGDLETALDHHHQALVIYWEVLGERHPSTLGSFEYAATILIRLNRRSEAYDLIAPYLKGDLPRQLKGLARELQRKPLRPGFRPPSSRSRRKGKKR